MIRGCSLILVGEGFLSANAAPGLRPSAMSRPVGPRDLKFVERYGVPPMLYGVPNASPHVERFNRALREEALNHFMALGARHVLRVCLESVAFYDRARPSQALRAIGESYPELREPVLTRYTPSCHGLSRKNVSNRP